MLCFPMFIERFSTNFVTEKTDPVDNEKSRFEERDPLFYKVFGRFQEHFFVLPIVVPKKVFTHRG